MPRATHALDALAAQLPKGGVVVRQTLKQVESLLVPGERPITLATGLSAGEFGVLALTSQRAVFVEWTNQRKAEGAVHELPRGALRARVEAGRLVLSAPHGTLEVEAVQPAEALAAFAAERGPTGCL
jgi:hypothetical protein